MQDLWGNEIPPPQTPTIAAATPTTTYRKTASFECAYYGHTWERIGLSDEKQCNVCGIKGYCPGCTSRPLSGAKIFYCTKHDPQAESTVQQ